MTWMEVTVDLQRQVCLEFGFGAGAGAGAGAGGGGGASVGVGMVGGEGHVKGRGGRPSLEEAVLALREASPRHLDVCFWQTLVQSKAMRGPLCRGDAIPDVHVNMLDDLSVISLSALVPSDGRPLAVV